MTAFLHRQPSLLPLLHYIRKRPEICNVIRLPHATTSRLAVNLVAADRPCSALMRLFFSRVHLAIHMTPDRLGLVLHMHVVTDVIVDL